MKTCQFWDIIASMSLGPDDRPMSLVPCWALSNCWGRLAAELGDFFRDDLEGTKTHGFHQPWSWRFKMGVCQNLVPLVNPKIACKWMFIPLKNGMYRYWSIPKSPWGTVFLSNCSTTVSHSEDRPPGPAHRAVINLWPRRVEIRAGHWIELREALHENMASKMEAWWSMRIEGFPLAFPEIVFGKRKFCRARVGCAFVFR